MVKKLLAGLALAFGMAAGSAAVAAPVTLADVIPDPLKGTGFGFFESFAVSGTGPSVDGVSSNAPLFEFRDSGGNPIGFNGYMIGTSAGPGLPLIGITFVDIFSQTIPTPDFLTGTFLDESVNVAAGTADLLFLKTGGTLASDFGDYFVLSLVKDPLGPLDTSGSAQDAVAYLTSAQLVNAVIPLPAGGVLLIGGLGLLAAVRRRKAA